MYAGANCKTPTLRLDITIRVKTVSDDLAAIEEVPIGKVVTSYVHPTSGERNTLIWYDALIFEGTLKSSLIHPNQVRAHGVIVSDVSI